MTNTSDLLHTPRMQEWRLQSMWWGGVIESIHAQCKNDIWITLTESSPNPHYYDRKIGAILRTFQSVLQSNFETTPGNRYTDFFQKKYNQLTQICTEWNIDLKAVLRSEMWRFIIDTEITQRLRQIERDQGLSLKYVYLWELRHFQDSYTEWCTYVSPEVIQQAYQVEKTVLIWKLQEILNDECMPSDRVDKKRLASFAQELLNLEKKSPWILSAWEVLQILSWSKI